MFVGMLCVTTVGVGVFGTVSFCVCFPPSACWETWVRGFGIYLRSSSILFDVFTPISALAFEWGLATEDLGWCTPHAFKKVAVSFAFYSGPPSLANSSGIPNVANVRLRQSISPLEPSAALSTIGQFEYRSTTTK